jgi:aspartate 4-decarboxylase
VKLTPTRSPRLTDAVIGDNYPEPDRMLVHTAHRAALPRQTCALAGRRPDARPVRGQAAPPGDVLRVRDTVREPHPARRGDTSLGSPSCTPSKLPRLDEVLVHHGRVAQDQMKDGRHVAVRRSGIDKLLDPG